MVLSKIKIWLSSLVFVAGVGGVVGAIAQPSVAYAAPTSCMDRMFLTVPTWYRGLVDANCEVITPDSDSLGSFIWKIVLNVIEMALQVVGYMAVGFIIYGGFIYMTTQGNPEEATKARKTIRDAIVGLVITLASVAIVNLVMGII